MGESNSVSIKRVGVHGLHDADKLETPSTLREKKRISRHHLDHSLRKLRKIADNASKWENPPLSPQDERFDVEPLPMSQRMVFRSKIKLSFRKFKDVHAMYQKDSADATSILKYTRHPYHGWYAFDRCAMRVEFEEQQKVTGQMGRLLPADSGFSRQSQELCEQVSQLHGNPSDVEYELLGEVGRIGTKTVEEWFKAKETRLKAHRMALRCRQHLVISANLKKITKYSD